MTSFPDQLKVGRAYYNRATAGTGYSEFELLGVPVTPIFSYEMGAVATTATASVFTATAGTTTITLTGADVTAGVATFATPRTLSLSATGNMSGFTFTAIGTDVYGAPLNSQITGPTGTVTVNGTRAYKTITSVTATGALTLAVSGGRSEVFGLPYRIANAGKVVGVYQNGLAMSSTGMTIVAGFTSTGVATATTPDVRGTITFATFATDGSAFYTVNIISPAFGVSAANDTRENSYGATQFS